MATSFPSPRVPYEIIDLIIRYSSFDEYFTYTQVSAPFRSLVYKQLTPIPYSSLLHANPSHRNLVIHLLNNQKPPASDFTTDQDNNNPHQTDEIFAPEFSLDEWFMGAKHVTMLRDLLKDWSHRTKNDVLPEGKSGDDGVDLVRSLGFYQRSE